MPRAHKIKFLRSFFQEKLFFQSFEINQYLSGRTLRDLENEKYIIAPLERLGYAHWYEDPARAERFYFVRWVDETRYSRLSLIHAAPESGAFWKEILRFRNWLRSHTDNDYAAYRAGDFGMRAPKVHLVPEDRFTRWMRSRGKYGDQNKVPRVLHDSSAVEILMAGA